MNGHLVFLCTGRSTSQLWAEVTDVGFDGIIAAAGATLEVRVGSSATGMCRSTTSGTLSAYSDARAIDYLLESNSGIYGTTNSKSQLRQALFGWAQDADLLAELQRGLAGFMASVIVGANPVRADINKIILLNAQAPIDALRAEFDGTFDVVPASASFLGPNSVELSIPGVNKGAAIEHLIEHLALSREDTLAFGDGVNDLEMLRYVKIGVAMGNARQQVRDSADDVTGSPEDNGIHDGFVKYGLI